MDFDVSRDFLDGLSLQHPTQQTDQNEVKANCGIRFLPSSPDGTMHTAIVGFTLQIGNAEQPFAQGGWRYLFKSSEKYDPGSDKGSQFHGGLLVDGASKIIAQLNNLCMHANMPLIPIDAQRLAQQAMQQQAAPSAE